ncbi:hypothetical protein TorRG33x02_116650 [Trema orientale]|uniref:Uncharacterized protein n=1 Tax=Trema orientale TaxID=63057 RepID=A0A2P5F446_TREOI|nr:hypothetical protein TorRG33x02_116650 [Trema orientale]
MSYGIDDVLDEWNTAILKSKIERETKESDEINGLASKEFLTKSESSTKIHGVRKKIHLDEKVRHLTLILVSNAEFPISIDKKNLRSFFVFCTKMPENPLSLDFIYIQYTRSNTS